MNRMHNSQFRMMMTYFTLAVAVITFFWIVTNLSTITGWIGWMFSVLSPFIGGFILAYILSIPAGGMQNLLLKTEVAFAVKFKKPISVIIVYLLFLLSIYGSMSFLVPRIIDAIADLVASFPELYQQFMVFLEDINQNEQLPFYVDLEEIITGLLGEDAVNNPLGFFSYETLLSYIGTIAGGANALFRGFLSFISSIYFLFEMERLGSFIKRMMSVFMSQKAGFVLLEYGHKINQYFKKYIFCLIIDCIVMWIVGTIILTIIGSPYAIFLGLLLGVMNLIPYFGSIIATVIAVIVVWFTQGAAMGAISTVILLISQQLDANVVQPRLYGTSLKLSPLLVIISVSVGGAIGGAMGGAVMGTVMGMIVAIPCAKVLMNILDDVVEHRERKNALHG